LPQKFPKIKIKNDSQSENCAFIMTKVTQGKLKEKDKYISNSQCNIVLLRTGFSKNFSWLLIQITYDKKPFVPDLLFKKNNFMMIE